MADKKPIKQPTLPQRYNHTIPAKSSKDKETNEIYIFVYWDEGGTNYFGDTIGNPSGVACSMSPATHENGTHRYSLTAGLRYMAAEAPRMNRKLILKVFDRIKYEIEHKVGKAWEVLSKVCEREHVTLG